MKCSLSGISPSASPFCGGMSLSTRGMFWIRPSAAGAAARDTLTFCEHGRSCYYNHCAPQLLPLHQTQSHCVCALPDSFSQRPTRVPPPPPPPLPCPPPQPSTFPGPPMLAPPTWSPLAAGLRTEGKLRSHRSPSAWVSFQGKENCGCVWSKQLRTNWGRARVYPFRGLGW